MRDTITDDEHDLIEKTKENERVAIRDKFINDKRQFANAMCACINQLPLSQPLINYLTFYRDTNRVHVDN